ncbi:MAG TPA: FAD-dependent oxidoreductase [Candidatus Acidoferrales bacterium]|nr:FAD-dependent oxidoreductase [Candidatus Acidoferrales bacterium]
MDQNSALYDVMVVGGGPAGLTAAVYAARKMLNVIILTQNIGGQALQSLDVENYMGFQFVSGQELMDRFQSQVEQYKVQKALTEVKRVAKDGDEFVALTTDGEEYRGKTVIIATGKKSRTLNAKGVDRLVGRGVSYCATCDAPLYVDVDVAVLGGGNSAITAAYELKAIAHKVYLINRSPWKADEVYLKKISNAQNIERLLGYELVEVIGDDALSAAVFRNLSDGSLVKLSVAGIFIEIGLIPNSGIVKDLVLLNKLEEIVVGCDCSTSLPGLFAAGDVTTVPEKQIIVAAGEGAKAAISAYKYILKEGQYAVVGY